MPDKQHYKIAFAGAPCVGKSTLVYGLERRNPQVQRMVDADETMHIIHIDIPLSQRHCCIALASGFFINDTVIPTVLTGATMVVYVVSTGMRPNHSRNFLACLRVPGCSTLAGGVEAEARPRKEPFYLYRVWLQEAMCSLRKVW